MTVSKLGRLRRIALTLPETTEELTWDDINFRVRKKIFCFPGEASMVVKADPEELDGLLGDARFSLAPYVGRFGWVTVQLTGKVDWAEVTELIRDSYRLVAPISLAAKLD